MTPYRLLCQTHSGITEVLAAMYSPDKLTGEIRIFITQKNVDLFDMTHSTVDYRHKAHQMTTKSNSSILCKYVARMESIPGTLAKYNVYRAYSDGQLKCITQKPEYTISDCLREALTDYVSDKPYMYTYNI